MRKLSTKKLSPSRQREVLKLYQKNEWYITRLATYVGQLFSLPPDDLKQEGFLGFLRAFELYNPKIAAFLTYAQYWIKMAMYDYAYRASYMVSIPNEYHVIASKCRKVCQEHSDLPSSAELSARLKIPEAKIKRSLHSVRALRNYTDISDIDKFVPGEVPDELPAKFPAFRVAREILSPQEYFILQYLFGKASDTPKTLAWVGQIVGVSKERVRQIRNGALLKLREFMEQNPDYATSTPTD